MRRPLTAVAPASGPRAAELAEAPLSLASLQALSATAEKREYAAADDALAREVDGAELGDSELRARVDELTREVERGRRAFEALSEQRRDALARRQPAEAERLLAELMRIAESRQNTVSKLTEATFEATCRSLPDCGAKAHNAYFDAPSPEAALNTN